jgi:ubiquinone/menaquinone biosynthesis C-methylase UbiE
MASNLSPVMKEASRIVKTGGHVIIAEVASRFEAKGPETDTVESFKSKLEKYFGLHVKSEEKLPPNSFFLVFKFVKKEFQPKLREATPSISLEACHYKPR